MIATVIVPTYRKKADVALLCLDELGRQLGNNLELLLLYDRKDGEDRWSRRLPVGFRKARLVELDPSPDKQESYAIQVGLELATTDWIWHQDDDAFFLSSDYTAFWSYANALATSCGSDLVTPFRIVRFMPKTEIGTVDRPQQLLNGCETFFEGSIACGYMWWFTGQPKLVRRKALLSVGTFHAEFKHYWWWDVAVSRFFEARYACSTVPLRAFLIEHERENFTQEKEANARKLEELSYSLLFNVNEVGKFIELKGEECPINLTLSSSESAAPTTT